MEDRKSTRLNSSHQIISYAVFCLKKKTPKHSLTHPTLKGRRTPFHTLRDHQSATVTASCHTILSAVRFTVSLCTCVYHCLHLVSVSACHSPLFFSFFFFNDTATTEIYTLSLHDALPI